MSPSDDVNQKFTVWFTTRVSEIEENRRIEIAQSPNGNSHDSGSNLDPAIENLSAQHLRDRMVKLTLNLTHRQGHWAKSLTDNAGSIPFLVFLFQRVGNDVISCCDHDCHENSVQTNR